MKKWSLRIDEDKINSASNDQRRMDTKLKN